MPSLEYDIFIVLLESGNQEKGVPENSNSLKINGVANYNPPTFLPSTFARSNPAFVRSKRLFLSREILSITEITSP